MIHRVATEATEAAEIWLLKPPTTSGPDLDLTLLSEEERRTLRRIGNPATGVRYAAAHIWLRRLLGERIGVRAADVRFAREPRLRGNGPQGGRPSVLDPAERTHFSLSYGGDSVLIGIAARPLGVDIEPVPEAARARTLARVLHPAEAAEIAADQDPALTFARIWTRKEAYLKGIGTGLGRALDADYLGLRDSPASPPGWALANLEVARGYAAAVAVHTGRQVFVPPMRCLPGV
ncbi:4'-phosphopantetheinyl transferase superfamily protein [Streptomyces sp. I6]|uniref:4'-phosphopantetheinyl transferase family protein n=1 Tax=Streptomyces sp. I6 TaxID=2483113 RepID=UPI000F45D583|nr:4'-phosphopantetheinyl transferase superfamily protein [Streptomyces sp. I6]RNL73915.1 4'-phosphopantetheinyl transferase superfamily protein [Streptomyces sp. I6]